ncbi:hypothetical protein ACFL27_00685 [candidate division CSSED10-310 bacterium]|uniref:DUF5667 domain-containing protein n=1 Tax=candidate division CSSED10-310 bacterium TaxID=2855610 RepID=A0ABV6YR63_UNCC1
MKAHDEDLRKLEQALKSAYHQPAQREQKRNWKHNVMREIRKIGPLQQESTNGAYLNRVIWRFSLAALTIALLLAIYALSTGFMPDNDVATIFMNDPAGILFYQPLEIL